MTEAVAPIERERPDLRPPITPAEAPADPAVVAADCDLTQQGAEANLGLVLRTSSGRIYPYSTFRRWLGEGGFEDPRRRDLPGRFPFTLITATRR